MPTVESLSSYINNPSCPIDSCASKDEATAAESSKSKNTKTHSSTQLSEHERRKEEMSELPLSFASFYYSLKVSKEKGIVLVCSRRVYAGNVS